MLPIVVFSAQILPISISYRILKIDQEIQPNSLLLIQIMGSFNSSVHLNY